MAEIKIMVTEEERRRLAAAVEELNNLQHISYMSRSVLSNTSGIKDTKLRAVLQEMLDLDELTQYATTQNKKLQRYYYVLTGKGKELLLEPTPAQ